MQLVAGGLEGVDLGGGEAVGGGLVPVGRAVFEGVEGEADGLDFLLPDVAGVRVMRCMSLLRSMIRRCCLFAGAATVGSAFAAAAAVTSALGEAAAEATSDGYTGAVGVAATGYRDVASAADYAAESVASPAAVVVAVGNKEGRKPPWPSGRCCWMPCWSAGRLAQRLSSTTRFCSSTHRCISGFWQPASMERAAAARSGAATCEERFMEGVC
ncbi:hypothetical protein [Tunturiibacter gelidiferens]|uniref:hypothetical protein n=1 Tax=Tunturiibacter gelidiferens TaxID=3069689 RepID=UPI003D9B1C2C